MASLKISINFHTTGRMRRGLFQLMSQDIANGVLDQDRLSLNEQVVKLLRDRYDLPDESLAYTHADEDKIEMSIRLPVAVHEKLIEEAKQNKGGKNKDLKSMNKIINMVIEQHIRGFDRNASQPE